MNVSCITYFKNFTWEGKWRSAALIIVLLVICATISAVYNFSQPGPARSTGLTRSTGTIKYPKNIDALSSANFTSEVHHFKMTNFLKAKRSNQTNLQKPLADSFSRMVEKKEVPKSLIIKKLKKDWGVEIDARSLDVFLGNK